MSKTSAQLQGPPVLIECTSHCGEWCDDFIPGDSHDWVIHGEHLTMECWKAACSSCNPQFDN